MQKTKQEILVKNVSTLGYWLYLEYAKQVLRMSGTRLFSFLGGAWFMLLSILITAFYVSGGGISAMLEIEGIAYTIFACITVSAMFLFGFMVVYSTIRPTILLASPFRTKHASKFFTDSKGIKHKKITVATTISESGITMQRADVIDEIPWDEIGTLAESKHFYFLILKGEVADPWRYLQAYIKTGIIFGKEGFTQGSWEDAKALLVQYGSDELKAQLEEKLSESASSRALPTV